MARKRNSSDTSACARAPTIFGVFGSIVEDKVVFQALFVGCALDEMEIVSPAISARRTLWLISGGVSALSMRMDDFTLEQALERLFLLSMQSIEPLVCVYLRLIDCRR